MTAKRSRRRDRLTEERVERIISIIELSTSKLTQEGLTDKVNADLDTNFTRVGLMKKAEIRRAFDKRGRAWRSGKPAREVDATTHQLNAKVETLRRQLAERDETIRAYKERFIHLYFNATRRGITVEDLELPMPVD
jgi:hypothetical protein